jgi:uncharacterized repeat protein (TIGR03806 family)
MSPKMFWLAVGFGAWGALFAGCSPPSLPSLRDASVEFDAGTEGGGDGIDAGVDAGVEVDRDTAIPDYLSAFGLFEPPIEGQPLQPTERNVRYQLTAALFSDFALKDRTLFFPKGKSARYRAQGVLDFPIGTIITKTFSFVPDFRRPLERQRRIETRVLVRQLDGWEAFPYVWNEQQTDATLAPGGRVYTIQFIDERGAAKQSTYAVPSRNQCLTCHHLRDEGGREVLEPIGPQSMWLSKAARLGGKTQNQLRYLADQGLLQELPAEEPAGQPDPFDPLNASLDSRARAYLAINCGHCHNPKATAGVTSQLFLNVENDSAFNLGKCKRPGSAGGNVGGTFDIVPGSHRTSILWFRLHTEESGKMMPQIGRSLRDERGSQLIADWIDAMPVSSCTSP